MGHPRGQPLRSTGKAEWGLDRRCARSVQWPSTLTAVYHMGGGRWAGRLPGEYCTCIGVLGVLVRRVRLGRGAAIAQFGLVLHHGGPVGHARGASVDAGRRLFGRSRNFRHLLVVLVFVVEVLQGKAPM